MQKNAHPRALTPLVALACVVALALIGFSFDQWTKQAFFDGFIASPHNPFQFFGGWIQQTIHRNYGMTFDVAIPLVIILLASCGCIIYLVSRLLFSAQPHWRKPLSLLYIGLILGGALGNLVDRLSLTFVRDWLLIGYLSALNLADLLIGIGLLGLSSILFQKTALQSKE